MQRLSSERPGGGEEAAEGGNDGGGEEPCPQGASTGGTGQGGSRAARGAHVPAAGCLRCSSCCQLPSSTELSQWASLVLAKTHPPAHLDSGRLLSMVRKEDVQRVIKEEETELARLEEMVKDK